MRLEWKILKQQSHYLSDPEIRARSPLQQMLAVASLVYYRIITYVWFTWLIKCKFLEWAMSYFVIFIFFNSTKETSFPSIWQFLVVFYTYKQAYCSTLRYGTQVWPCTLEF